jgi:hypothetical protein
MQCSVCSTNIPRPSSTRYRPRQRRCSSNGHRHEGVEVALDLVGPFVPLGPALEAEALVEQRAIHALDEIGETGSSSLNARRASDSEEVLLPSIMREPCRALVVVSRSATCKVVSTISSAGPGPQWERPRPSAGRPSCSPATHRFPRPSAPVRVVFGRRPAPRWPGPARPAGLG